MARLDCTSCVSRTARNRTHVRWHLLCAISTCMWIEFICARDAVVAGVPFVDKGLFGAAGLPFRDVLPFVVVVPPGSDVGNSGRLLYAATGSVASLSPVRCAADSHASGVRGSQLGNAAVWQ